MIHLDQMMKLSTVLTSLALLALPVLAKPFAAIEAVQPDRVLARATPTLTGSATATQRSGEYFGPVVIDGITYSVLYDTGSNALWIKNGTSVSGPGFSVTYGSGTVSGNVTSGTVSVAGSTIMNQRYGVATSWNPAYNGYDGILGLGKSSTQLGGYSTWMANAMPLYKQPLFAVNMPPTGSATYTFGYDETAHENGPLSFKSTTGSTNLWTPTITSFNIPANDTSMDCNIDSGTTDIYVPSSIAYAFWNQVSTATTTDGQKWTFPCSNSGTVPNFSVTIGGVKYIVAAANTYFQDTPTHGVCGSRLQGRPSGCILGQPFFYSNYVAYHYGNMTVGLTGRK
ncbi:aspartic peptidase domain-containing protein [Xylaria flabelliformis]|nr:aspartic peptidase domain-containing protein [Xylaria flabelliformis]